MNNQKGFSLLEILIAIALGGMILTVVGTNVMGTFLQGKIGVAENQIQSFAGPLDQFKMDCNRYPTQEQGLDALVQKPAGSKCRRYQPSGYMEKIPMDPWDMEYIYQSSDGGRSYEIISYGEDQIEGGDDDISSEDL